MCHLVAHLLQCRSSLYLYPGSGLLLLCFSVASLWLERFLWVGRRRVVFAPPFLCVWSQRPWVKSTNNTVASRIFAKKIQLIVKIDDVVDLFHRKPFWLFQYIFWILDERYAMLYYALLYITYIPSSISCHAISMDIPDPLSPHLLIVHWFLQIHRVTSCIGTELMYIGFSWTSGLCSSIWRGPL